MGTHDDSLDLYTLWKRTEQETSSQISTMINAIPLRNDTSKYLVPTYSQVFYTDGYSTLKSDHRYERTQFDDEMEVPSIGTDRKNFDFAEMITFDILGASTRLPMMCKMIIYQQGATHEREPPILVRDACLQWDGPDRMNSFSLNSSSENGLQRTRSSDFLLEDRSSLDRNRRLSVNSSLTDDDDLSSVITAGGTYRHRISRLLHRHKYRRQIDANLLGLNEFYSVPFYQYRGRRYGQNHVASQTNARENYSVTMIFPPRNEYSMISSPIFQVNRTVNHSTVVHLNTRQYITIERTFQGRPLHG